MSGIWAKSVLASKHAITGARLDTMLVRFPRVVLPEANTHRALSKNTASSRAIPIQKLIQQVVDDPFVPEVWTKNQSGMQGYEVLTGDDAQRARGAWLAGRDKAVQTAWQLHGAGLHKQIVNRVLEPWMWTIAVWSATEWDNFFALRDHHAAEPHIQILARAIRKARDEAYVQTLQPGDWHLPFVPPLSQKPIDGLIKITTPPNQTKVSFDLKLAQTWSTACCASTSYKTVDGFAMDIERARKIYASLSGPPLHASPYEHVCVADDVMDGKYQHIEDHGNFKGFRQYRAHVERESV